MNHFILITLFLGFQFSIAQQTQFVDFKTGKADLSIYPDQGDVIGKVTYTFDVLKPIDSIFIDAQNIDFYEISLNGDALVSFSYDEKKLWLLKSFKPSKNNVITIEYETHPQKSMYFIGWDKGVINRQVWTQGQGKYTSNWLPSFDDMNAKVEFDLIVTFDKNYEVIANGKLINKQINDATITWFYDMQKPMSSYLIALAIGKYDKKVEYSKSGIPIELFYYPEDSLKFEPTYRYTKQIFDFLEDEIGVQYPWQNYKQVPVKDFLYAGMENTSTTIFSDGFMVDSIAFVDKNYVNVNAHELAHQWFGDLVTEISGTHHWLQEGFATYYALLAEKGIFGDDYYYWQLYEYAHELLDQEKLGQGTSLLNPKSSSTTFYKKGAWLLHVLREQVGDSAFKSAVKNYLKEHQFKNVETNDFISEVELASGQDLGEFVKVWLESDAFNFDSAMESLKKSVFIQEYLMVDCELYNSKCEEYLSSGISEEAKTKVVSQMPNRLKKEDFKNNLKVRQAIAKSLSVIPLELIKEYESLLMDASYITIEVALFNLWKNFPQERHEYLNKTKGIQGFNDKNVRILWLTLALITEDFEPESKGLYFEELTDYTSPKYGFEIRQNAFLYLQQIKACNGTCKENLEEAAKHHNWQFSKFAKALLYDDQ